MSDPKKLSSGVEELIERLRDEGVKAGNQEASKVLEEAEHKAQQIIEQAKTQASDILSNARSEIETEQNAARESLRIAIRDTTLELEQELKSRFDAHVRRLVSKELEDKEFLKKLILAIAGVATYNLSKDQYLDLLLTSELFEFEEEDVNLTKLGKERLRYFILGITGDMLREGIELSPSRDINKGIRIKLAGEDLEIDLTENAISDLLLKYILPRYKEIVTGVE